MLDFGRKMTTLILELGYIVKGYVEFTVKLIIFRKGSNFASDKKGNQVKSDSETYMFLQ